MKRSLKEFSTGAKREDKDGKARVDLIPPEALWEWGLLMAQGAMKHGDRNWEKGLPLSSFIQSAHRHLTQLMLGHVDENHAANVLFNIGGFMSTRARIAKGVLPAELNDLPDYMKKVGDLGSIPEDSRTI